MTVTSQWVALTTSQREGFLRTVVDAGQTIVAVATELGHVIYHLEIAMRTDLGTGVAADAGLGVQLQQLLGGHREVTLLQI